MPAADAPKAVSTEDFAELDTFYTEGMLRDSYETIGGKIYYELDLENGENVLVQVDWDATEVLEPQLRRMPVGRWVEMTPEQIGPGSIALPEGGCDAKDIPCWLGHSDVSTTLNLYGHLLGNDMVKLGEVMEHTLFQSP